MRCLIIRDPWATAVVEGKKPVEFRKAATRIRERVGIIAAKTGTVIGEVDLVDCIDRPDYDLDYCFGWVCLRPIKYKRPKPYKHPNGAQQWVNVPIEPERPYNAQISAKEAKRAETYERESNTTKANSFSATRFKYVCKCKSGKSLVLYDIREVRANDDITDVEIIGL